MALVPHTGADAALLLDDKGVTLMLTVDDADRLLAACPATGRGLDASGRRVIHIGAAACASDQVRGIVLLFALQATAARRAVRLDDAVAADALVGR